MSHIGVIVGRFQTPYLHEGHLHLFRTAAQQSARLIVFLGVAPVPVSKSDPLDFATRKQMLEEQLIEIAPRATILPLSDHPSDVEWVRNLDTRIREVEAFADIKLYGGRHSFLDTYRWHSAAKLDRVEVPTWVLEQSGGRFSATDVRKETSFTSVASEDFRAGVVYASQRRYDSGLATVDIAIYDRAQGKILLGRKRGQKQFRFVGGFFDPANDAALENTARREAYEETGLELGPPKYAGSAKINDWRYKTSDRIITTLFVAEYLHGAPAAGDDIEEVRWFPLGQVNDNLVPEHAPLRKLLDAYFQKEAIA